MISAVLGKYLVLFLSVFGHSIEITMVGMRKMDELGIKLTSVTYNTLLLLNLFLLKMEGEWMWSGECFIYNLIVSKKGK